MFESIVKILSHGKWRIRIILVRNMVEFDLKGIKSNWYNEMRLYLDGMSGYLIVLDIDTIEICKEGYHIKSRFDDVNFLIVKKENNKEMFKKLIDDLKIGDWHLGFNFASNFLEFNIIDTFQVGNEAYVYFGDIFCNLTITIDDDIIAEENGYKIVNSIQKSVFWILKRSSYEQ